MAIAASTSRSDVAAIASTIASTLKRTSIGHETTNSSSYSRSSRIMMLLSHRLAEDFRSICWLCSIHNG
jgi:hypothetical protein